jgi:hypothetical protein
MKKYE